ncbi:hypothetical protein OH77DRAFT_1418168 [Trametes cingulata]|nr:hypothetical protein OH77DRAFT_1418168 [Trametes cingulata]
MDWGRREHMVHADAFDAALSLPSPTRSLSRSPRTPGHLIPSAAALQLYSCSHEHTPMLNQPPRARSATCPLLPSAFPARPCIRPICNARRTLFAHHRS